MFLAQGFGKPGWTTLEECAKSAAANGFTGMQVPLWIKELIDLDQAAVSTDYCQERLGRAKEAGCPIVEVANHCETQLVCCSPAYVDLHKWVVPKELKDKCAAEICAWAQNRAMKSVAAAANLDLTSVAAFSGTTMFPYVYPWPQRPKGMREAAFNHLAACWLPVFNLAAEKGVDVCFELHPGEDLMDGDTFEYFLKFIGNHPRCCQILDLSHFALQGMTNVDFIAFIHDWKDRIKMWHVKDGEFVPDGNGGVYGGYNDWTKRRGRFRSLGDGMIDYRLIFQILGVELGMKLIACLEWECCFKRWSQGIREGVAYINAWINGTPEPEATEPEAHTEGAFDDFASGAVDTALIAKVLGIPEAQVSTSMPKA